MGILVGIVAAALLIGCLILFCIARCSARSSANSTERRCEASDEDRAAADAAAEQFLLNPPLPPVAVLTTDMKTLNREAIRVLLKWVADTPVPKSPIVCACCYMVAEGPNRSDYLCPRCGERTLYDVIAKGDKTLSARQKRREIVDAVEYGIPACRQEMQELRKLVGDAISLDESQFCRKCSPTVTEPTLVLHVAYAEGQPQDTVTDVTLADLRLLHKFLAGELFDNDGIERTPLNESLPRLQTLLGMRLGG
jgi:hypothetical protein